MRPNSNHHGRRIRRRLASIVSQLAHPVLSRVMAHEGILGNPYISGKYVPIKENATHFVFERSCWNNKQSDGLPVPPEGLWEGWGPTTEDYLASGRTDIESMVQILSRAGETAAKFDRVLDLGCAAGRMLRFFPSSNSNLERWGVDIKAKHIAWCQANLAPPFRFVTTTTSPHLPFEDNYFDLVYCGSVFTHMSELADAWLLELLRVIRRGGYAYITIHDKHSLELLTGRYRHRSDYAFLVNAVLRFQEQTDVLNKDFSYFSIYTEPQTQVFYNVSYLLEKWSIFARPVSVTLEAMGYQTALLLQKHQER